MSQRHAGAHPHPDGDTYSYGTTSNAYPDSNKNPDTYPDSDSYPDPYPYTDQNSYPHPDFCPHRLYRPGDFRVTTGLEFNLGSSLGDGRFLGSLFVSLGHPRRGGFLSQGKNV